MRRNSWNGEERNRGYLGGGEKKREKKGQGMGGGGGRPVDTKWK